MKVLYKEQLKEICEKMEDGSGIAEDTMMYLFEKIGSDYFTEGSFMPWKCCEKKDKNYGKTDVVLYGNLFFINALKVE